jgi:hypothetical protein
MKKGNQITHVFRGRRYTIEDVRQRKMRGFCDDPKSTEKILNIPSNGATLDNLTTIIHEGLHACIWDLTEDSIEETSDSIAKLLWRLGWRKK